MKAKNYFLFPMLIAVLLVLGACTSDDLNSSVDFTSIAKDGDISIKFVKSDYNGIDSLTRTSLESGDFSNQYKTVWNSNESIGLFKVSPNAVGNTEVILPNASGSSTSSVEYGLIQFLSAGDKIVAYYPYSSKISSYSNIPFSFEYQCQDGKNSYTHLSNYDYLYSKTVTCVSNQQSIPMYHFGAILKLNIKLPVAASWKKIILFNPNGNKCFMLNGFYNASNGAVTSSEKSSFITLKLDDVITKQKNEVVSFYVCVPRITTQKLEVIACTDDDDFYSMKYNCGFSNGKAYTINLNEMKKTQSWVDLGLSVLWSTCNLGAKTKTDIGKYYAWAEKKGRGDRYDDNYVNQHHHNSYIKDIYDWYSYFDYSGLDQYGYASCGKYHYDFYHDYNFFSEDDAASIELGDNWRIPTYVEFKELIDNCVKTPTNITLDNGVRVYGYTFYSNKTDNSIFLPITGYVDGSKIYKTDVYNPAIQSEGFYWTSTMSSAIYSEYKAFCMTFGNSYYIGYNGSEEYPKITLQDKYLGYALRPVRK